MPHNKSFWQSLTNLIDTSEIIIDRPRGAHHPNYPEIVYPLDYGYLKGTSSPDGKEIDVWVGSLEDKHLVGIAVTVDLMKRDSEIKVLLGLSDEEIDVISEFHNCKWQHAVIVRVGE